MQEFRKISFSEILRKFSQTEKLKYSIKNFSYFPAIFIYGFEIIFLLKISQIVLGWRF